MSLYLSDHDAGVLAFATLKPAAPPRRIDPTAATGALARPFGAAVVKRRTLLVADTGRDRIVAIRLDVAKSRAIGAAGPAGPFVAPRGVAVLPDGRIVVADTGAHRLMTSAFTFADWMAGRASDADWSAFGTAGTGEGQFKAPQSVHADGSGRLWVADPALQRLVRMDAPDGSGWSEIALPPGTRPLQPYGLAAGPNGGVLVTDLLNARVLFVAADGAASVWIDGSASRRLIAPVAAVLRGRRIVVADAAAARLTEWSRPKSGTWRFAAERLGGAAFAKVVSLASSTTGIVMDLGGQP